MARKISVGVLGIGTVAELFYLEAIVKHGDRAGLTALCDVGPGRAQAAADKWAPGPRSPTWGRCSRRRMSRRCWC